MPVANLRPILTNGRFYVESSYTRSGPSCVDPYALSLTAPGPRSADEAYSFWRRARIANDNIDPTEITVPWVTVSTWYESRTEFSVRADLSNVLARHGPGG